MQTNSNPPFRSLVVLELALDVLRRIRPLIGRVREGSTNLASQIENAATSMVLNLGEAAGSSRGTRRARLDNALGSTEETVVGLRAAAALAYLTDDEITPVLTDLRRVGAMTYRWIHRRTK
jgi:four helix bundle protein